MNRLDLCGQPLHLDLTLCCGQAFRWRKTPDGVWQGVVRDKLVELAVEDESVLWRTFPGDDEALVRDYLRLDDDVNAIYSSLSAADPHLAEVIERFHGLRLVRQDPSETLLSFVCSAASSIPRITAAIEALASQYGTLVCEKNGSCFYTFPTMEILASAGPRLLGDTRYLGFRDRKLVEVSRQVLERGPGWLDSLRHLSYREAQGQLMSIKGVGAKIADCVCLFALDKDEAVPVDTHVAQLASRQWNSDLQPKTLTGAAYRRIADEFVSRYGAHSGWAQQFLYFEQLTRSRSKGRGVRWCGRSVE